MAHGAFDVHCHICALPLTPPLPCSDAFITWLEAHYPGIYRGKDLHNDWLAYAARARFRDDMPRQQALKFMLLVACSPTSVASDFRSGLKSHGWRGAQVRLPLRPLFVCAE